MPKNDCLILVVEHHYIQRRHYKCEYISLYLWILQYVDYIMGDIMKINILIHSKCFQMMYTLFSFRIFYTKYNYTSYNVIRYTELSITFSPISDTFTHGLGGCMMLAILCGTLCNTDEALGKNYFLTRKTLSLLTEY